MYRLESFDGVDLPKRMGADDLSTGTVAGSLTSFPGTSRPIMKAPLIDYSTEPTVTIGTGKRRRWISLTKDVETEIGPRAADDRVADSVHSYEPIYIPPRMNE